MNKRIANLDWASAVQFYEAGKSLTAIAQHMGCSAGAVANNLRKHGVEIDSTRRRDQTGEKNHNFKGGLSRSTIRKLTAKVLSDAGRDLYLCERCGYRGVQPLDRHHKDRDRSNNDISNLEVLCVRCHNSGWEGAEHRRLHGINGRFI